jgi:hypothetical protein
MAPSQLRITQATTGERRRSRSFEASHGNATSLFETDR